MSALRLILVGFLVVAMYATIGIILWLFKWTSLVVILVTLVWLLVRYRAPLRDLAPTSASRKGRIILESNMLGWKLSHPGTALPHSSSYSFIDHRDNNASSKDIQP
jgi:hypothetical protein